MVRQNRMNWIKKISQPRILVPVLLSLALLAFVFTISDLPRVIDRIRGVPIYTAGTVFWLAVIYLVLKGMQFHYFLVGIQIHPYWKDLALAYAVGEMVITLPAGSFAQNYMLRRIQGIDFSRSSAATAAILAVEGSIALLGLAVLGIPTWDWLQPAVIGFIALMAALVVLFAKAERVGHLARDLLQAGPLEKIGPEFIETVDSLRQLFNLRTAAVGVSITVTYLGILLVAFWLIGQGVGITTFTYRQAATVYLFALAVTLLSPVSTQLGVIEASGLGAMQAWGYDYTAGLAAMLGFRLVWVGSIWLSCGIVLLLLRNELSKSSNDHRQEPPD